ncbi:methyltransferase domain protein [delta proteobacterium NaphS2]|nr:methyltransferase domain protein [delta proteobacterium NaphS2]
MNPNSPPSPKPGIWAEKWARQTALWNRERCARRGNLDSRKFWNGFDLWDAYEPHTRYPGELIRPILKCIRAQTTVLDVGAGTGALALPMAAAARRVTAVDVSSAQCQRLRKKAEDSGVHNVAVVESSWEKINVETLGPHDMVTAGYCLFMADIQGALWKMRRLSRGRIFLVHLASHDLQRPMARILGSRTAFPDHQMLLNLLREMGWDARYEIFTRDFQLPLDLQMAMFRYAQGFDEGEIKAIKTYLRKVGRVFTKRGEAWVRRQYKDALISVEWTPQNDPESDFA